MSNATETPTPVNEHELIRDRVIAIASWLADGRLRPECVSLAMQEWQVSRRTAQVYVARAAAKMVRLTTFEDPLFALKLSQVQRGKLHQELQNLLRNGDAIALPIWQMKLKTIQADLKLLDSRDRTAARIVQMNGKDGDVAPRRPAREAGLKKKLRPDPGATACRPGEATSALSDVKAGKPAPGLAEPAKMMRPEPPTVAPAAAQTRPVVPAEKAKPPANLPFTPVATAFAEKVWAALEAAAAQPTAGIAIVPPPKAKGNKDIRPAQGPGTGPAPEQDSCAWGTKPVRKPAATNPGKED